MKKKIIDIISSAEGVDSDTLEESINWLEKSSKRITIDELAHYCFWCDGKQFNKDIYQTDDKNYIDGKFPLFRDNFTRWLYSLDNENRKKLGIAIKKFNKEKEEL